MKRATYKVLPCLLASAALLLTVPVQDAEARGGRGGGGFSRSSPARSGSFSSPEMREAVRERRDDVERSDRSRDAEDRAQHRRRDTRPSQASDESRDAARESSAAIARRETARAAAASSPAVRDASPEDMARYRAQFARDNPQFDPDDNEHQDGDRWDRPPPVDPDYGVPRVPPALVAGAIAARRDNAAGYYEGYYEEGYVVNDDEPDFYSESELPCSIDGNMEYDGAMYYRCNDAWYKRVFRGDDVVYVPTAAPGEH